MDTAELPYEYIDCEDGESTVYIFYRVSTVCVCFSVEHPQGLLIACCYSANDVARETRLPHLAYFLKSTDLRCGSLTAQIRLRRRETKKNPLLRL